MKRIGLFFAAVVILLGSLYLYIDRDYATPILMYHSLDKSKIEFYAAVDPNVFRKQMEYIRNGGYRVIPLQEYCRLLKTNQAVPKKSLVITFDDGYKDNLRAFEILKEFGYPATIFIITRDIGKNDFLSAKDIGSLLSDQDSKVSIGSHTLSHAYLPDQDRLVVKREIFQSKGLLEEDFSREIDLFSYPVGGFTKEALSDVEEAGYLCACTTNRGFSRGINRFALRRIKITNRDLGFRLWVKLSGFYNSFRKLKNPY